MLVFRVNIRIVHKLFKYINRTFDPPTKTVINYHPKWHREKGTKGLCVRVSSQIRINKI